MPNRGVEGAFIPQLSFSDVYDRLGECLRRFLRQIMSDATGNEPVLIFAGEFLGIGDRKSVV